MKDTLTWSTRTSNFGWLVPRFVESGPEGGDGRVRVG